MSLAVAKAQCIRHGKIITEEGIIADGAIVLENGRIVFVGSDADWQAHPEYSKLPSESAQGDWIVPGFIDIHVHGGNGHDFMEGTQEAFRKITEFHIQHGTTSMLATSVTSSKKDIDHMLQGTEHFLKSKPTAGAALLGVHLEGPFLSKVFPGAQNPIHMIPPQLDWLQEWTHTYPGLIRMMTLAPEVEGGMKCIAWLKQNHIVPAAGHTDASYDDLHTAVGHGLQHAVHTFNAMRGLHHREPGTAGAVMINDQISCEVIADGHHVHPACIQLLAKAKSPDHLVLITDAMAAAGMPDGDYNLGELIVNVKDGVARLKDGESLAGSTLTMIQGFRYLVETVGVSTEDASRMASLAPARVLGMDKEIGSIKTGKRADLLRLTKQLNIKTVWNKGRMIVNNQ